MRLLLNAPRCCSASYMFNIGVPTCSAVKKFDIKMYVQVIRLCKQYYFGLN